MHDPTPCIDSSQRESVYASLTESVRRLIDVTIRGQPGPAAVAAAKAKIDGAADELSVVLRPGPLGVQLMPDGQSVAWGNAVVGLHNPVAPPLVIHHEPDGVVWSEFVLGAPYEGPPGNVHGGVCPGPRSRARRHGAPPGRARVRRHPRPSSPASDTTGTATARAGTRRTHRRGQDVAVGHLADADGITVEAEGIFIHSRQNPG